MKQEVSLAKVTQYLAYAIAVILVLLPFHAFFTTWAAPNFGHFDLLRIWKELLMVPLGLVALFIGYKNPTIKQWLQTAWLFYLILAYIGLQIVAAGLALHTHHVNSTAAIYALLANNRFFIFFIVCLVASGLNPWLKNNWRALLLWPALIVISFGLLQHFVLPPDALRHVGYGPETIPATQTIDQKSQYTRLQSTLRGPNPLGAYLVLITAAIVALLLKDKKGRKYWTYLLAVTCVVLFYTYSRSAWGGAVIAIGLLAWWQLKNKRWRSAIVATAGILLVISVAGTFMLRHNDYFQNTFFHTDEHSRSPDSSNFDRASALQSGVRDVIDQPLGYGPGTAGPASVRNNNQVRISENYFLQIGQEVGIIGMALFVAINILVGISLWRIHDTLSLILLASLVGITTVNMLSHAWSDDTLSLLWWGFAGIAIGSGILQTNNEHKSHGKTK